MGIDAVVFDMDGLMFDTERVFMRAWDYAGEQMGLGKTGYMVLKTLGSNTAECERIWQEDFPGVDLAALWEHSRVFHEKYYAENPVPVKKGLYELLSFLRERGIPMAVASSTKREKVLRHLKSAGIADDFAQVIAGDMVTRSKPEPDIYRTACAALGVAPEGCIALEDSRNGLLSAHRAGCQAVMVPDLWQPDDEVRAFIRGPFESLAEVKDWLENELREAPSHA